MAADRQELQLVVTLENGQFKVAAKDTASGLETISKKTAEVGDKSQSNRPKVEGFGKSLSGIATAAKMFMGLQVVQWFGRVGMSAVKAAADYEQNRVALEVLLGSTEKAKKLMEDIRKFGAATPYEQAGLIENVKMMLNFGLAAEDVMENIQMLGDVAGGNQEKLSSLTLAFSQMSSTGRLMGQDLLQMINAGFNPLQIISAKTGKSMGALKKEMEAGAISSDMVRDAFKAATSEGGQFFKMMEKQSKTLAGVLSNLSDQAEEIKRAFGTGLAGSIKTIGSEITGASNAAKLLEKSFYYVGVVVGTVVEFLWDIVMLMPRIYGKAIEIYDWAKSKITGKPVEEKTTGSPTLKPGGVSSGGGNLSGGGGKDPVKEAERLAREEAERLAREEAERVAREEEIFKQRMKNYSEFGSFVADTAQKITDAWGMALENMAAAEEARYNNVTTLLGAALEQRHEMELEAAGVREESQIELVDKEIGDLQFAYDKERNLRRRALIQKDIDEKIASKKELELRDKHDQETKRLELVSDLWRRQLALRQWKRNQQMQLSNVWIQYGIATMSAIASAWQTAQANWYLGLALTAASIVFNTAMAGVATQQIMSQKPPSFAKGVFDINRNTPAMVHQGETILDAPITQGLKDNNIAVVPSGGDSGGARVIQLVVDGRKLAEVVDDNRSRRASRMSANNYAYGSVYK